MRYKIRAYNDQAWYEVGIYYADSKEEAKEKCIKESMKIDPYLLDGLKLEVTEL